MRASIAILAALAFALDPVQIVHEHLVMAETAALLAMALFLLVALKYLQDPAPQWLVVLSLLGILLVSLRIVYLPVVLVAAVLLPVFAYVSSPGLSRRVLVIALAVSCGSAALFHLGYRQLTGWLAGREPAYHYVTGFFLVSTVAPLLEPRDAGDVRLADAIVAQNKSGAPLFSRAFRSDQLWAEDGFVARLRRIFNGDERAADQAAQRLARAAIERNPLGFLKLGVLNYFSFWGGLRYLHISLQWENGSQLPSAPVPYDAAVIRSVFGVDVSNQYALLTPSRRYHLSACYWAVFLLASPFLAGFALWLGPANPKGVGFLLCWNCLLLAATCLGADESAYRYLHPFSWTGLAAAAVLCEILISRRTRA